MDTRTIYLPKMVEKDTDKGIIKSLKECTITIPKNVIDAEYFTDSVQFHIINVAVCNMIVDLNKVNQDLETLKREKKTDSISYKRATDKRNDLLVLQKLLKDFTKNFDEKLTEEYEDIKEVKSVFLSDSFAKVYSWTVTGCKARKVWKSGNESGKGKIEEIQFHFNDEDRIVSLLKDFDFSTSQEQKKSSAKQIELLANELFSTNGGELYKNVSFNFSVGKINSDLYTRFKKLYTHDGKGNIKDLENSAFELCKQLYFMCLLQLGVPSINGQKVIKVDEVADCRAVLTVSRKKKEEKKEEKKAK